MKLPLNGAKTHPTNVGHPKWNNGSTFQKGNPKNGYLVVDSEFSAIAKINWLLDGFNLARMPTTVGIHDFLHSFSQFNFHLDVIIRVLRRMSRENFEHRWAKLGGVRMASITPAAEKLRQSIVENTFNKYRSVQFLGFFLKSGKK